MNVLVDGCAGFIGRHLVEKLLVEGHEVYGIDNLCNSTANGQLLKKENFAVADISDTISILRGLTVDVATKIDVVYHLAAQHSVPDSFERPVTYYQENIIGTHNICYTFPNARIVNISSSAAVKCISPYGISKLGAEKVAALHKNSVSLRLFNVFGEGQPDIGCIMPRFIKTLLRNEKPVIFGDGKQSRDFTYVKDVVNQIYEYGQGKRESYHDVHEVGYGNSVEVNDVVGAICDVIVSINNYSHGFRILPEYAPERIGDIRYSQANEKIENPEYGFNKGLERTVKWFAEKHAEEINNQIEIENQAKAQQQMYENEQHFEDEQMNYEEEEFL